MVAQARPERASWLATLFAHLRQPRIIGPLLGGVVALVAAYVIYQISGTVKVSDIRGALATIWWPAIFKALGFTAASFVAISLYDVLAIDRVAPRRVSPGLAAYAGATGYAIANAVGFNVVLGGPIRYRIYASVGLDAADVGRVVGISFAAFWLGLAAIIGLALVFDPEALPLFNMVSRDVEQILGIAVIAALTAMLIWLWRREPQIRIFSWRIPLPHGASALMQIGIGMLDIAAAAAALYVLLPADVVASGFTPFLLVFAAAILAATLSHAPGGLGVLEATVLVGLGAGNRPDVIAALLIFRIVYYYVPLFVAGAGLLGFEAWRARRPLRHASRMTFRTIRPIVAPLLAGLVFIGGVVLIVSGNAPPDGARIAQLRTVLPLSFVEAAHLFSSLTGLLLIILARGLAKRISLARTASMWLLLAGAVFSLVKGLDWEEGAIMVAIAGALSLYASVFYRKGDWRAFRPNPAWLALVVLTLVCLTLLGLFVYRDVTYTSGLWGQFGWADGASRFLRATLLLGLVTCVFAVDALLNRPALSRPVPMAVPVAVRRLLENSPATHPWVALLGDKRFMVAGDGSAFVMYGIEGQSWVTMGDPVGVPATGRDLIWRFAEQTERAGARVVYYGVTSEFVPVYLDLGLSILKVGEVARVPLAGFSLDDAGHGDLRAAERQAKRDGLKFDVIPKAGVSALIPELKAVSDAWLAAKSGEEKSFSLGRFDAGYIPEFDCAVVRKRGAVVAFANLWRSAGRNELSLDLLRYRPEVSTVIRDALLIRTLLYGRAQGYSWFNLGAAPLTDLAQHPLGKVWSRIGTRIYRLGEEFENVDELRAYKQKFGPVWTPQHLACRGGLVLSQVLVDVFTLIAGKPATERFRRQGLLSFPEAGERWWPSVERD